MNGRRLWMYVVIRLPGTISSIVKIKFVLSITWNGPRCLGKSLLPRPTGGVNSTYYTPKYVGHTRQVGGYQTVAGEPVLLGEGCAVVQSSYQLCRIELLDQ